MRSEAEPTQERSDCDPKGEGRSPEVILVPQPTGPR